MDPILCQMNPALTRTPVSFRCILILFSNLHPGPQIVSFFRRFQINILRLNNTGWRVQITKPGSLWNVTHPAGHEIFKALRDRQHGSLCYIWIQKGQSEDGPDGYSVVDSLSVRAASSAPEPGDRADREPSILLLLHGAAAAGLFWDLWSFTASHSFR